MHQVERHRNANKVFILTEGKADLVLFNSADVVEAGGVPMTHYVVYNVPDHSWHHVVVSKDAHVIQAYRDGQRHLGLRRELENLRAKLRF